LDALIIMWLWKISRPSEQRRPWSISAKRQWITSLPGMQWVYIVSPDMLEYEVIKSPMSPQGASLFWGFLDPSRPWVTLDETYKTGFVAGWLTSFGKNAELLVIPKDRLEK
jgi:hypothetical protein